MKQRYILIFTLAVGLNINSQTVYQLDNKFQYNWDTILVDWALVGQDVYTFGNGGNKETNKLTQYYIGGVWVNSLIVNSTYNGSNNLEVATTLAWNPGTMVWSDLTRQENTYDGSQNLTVIKLFTQIASLNLDLFSQTDYQFNGSNLLTESVHQQYNATTMLLENLSKSTLAYTGEAITEIITQDWEVAKTSKYNSTLRGVGEWVNLDRDNLFYDGFDNLIRWETTAWENGSAWAVHPYEQQLNTYNGSNLITEGLFQDWDGASWVNKDRELFTYIDDNPTGLLFQSWNTTTKVWDNTAQILQSFDDNDNIIEQIFQNFVGTGRAFENTSKITSSWSVASNLSVTIEDKTNVKMYPNPFKSSITLGFQDPIETDGYINLYDITGKVLAKKLVRQGESKIEFNLPYIAQGAYFMDISVGENRGHYKVIKN